MAVTCPSWLTDRHPAAVEKFWSDAGSGLDTVGRNTEVLQQCGYQLIEAFTPPETCWTDNYFTPREAAIKALSDKYHGSETVREFAAENRYEVELYEKHKRDYGYVFYIGRKI